MCIAETPYRYLSPPLKLPELAHRKECETSVTSVTRNLQLPLWSPRFPAFQEKMAFTTGGQWTNVSELLTMTAAVSPLAVYTLFFNRGHQRDG